MATFGSRPPQIPVSAESSSPLEPFNLADVEIGKQIDTPLGHRVIVLPSLERVTVTPAEAADLMKIEPMITLYCDVKESDGSLRVLSFMRYISGAENDPIRTEISAFGEGPKGSVPRGDDEITEYRFSIASRDLTGEAARDLGSLELVLESGNRVTAAIIHARLAIMISKGADLQALSAAVTSSDDFRYVPMKISRAEPGSRASNET